jgi:hypothetical protein
VKKITVLLVAVALMLSGAAQAQSQYEELLRQDLRTMKTAIVTEAMMLTEEEGEAFWPIYRDYDNELAKHWDSRLALIQSYAEKFESMDDATADQLMKDAMKLRGQRMDLRNKYYKKMKKEVGAILAARFAQIDGVIQNIVDLQIASELPLVIRTAPEGEGGS